MYDQHKFNQVLRETAQEEALYKTSEDKRFVKLRTSGLVNLYRLSKGCIGLLLYLRSSVNRDVGYKEVNGQIVTWPVWCNLQKYYCQGYLATARTQTYIAKETGYSQSNISRWLKELKEKEYIKQIGIEMITVKGNIVPVPVYALGQIVDINNQKHEVFYHEVPYVESP